MNSPEFFKPDWSRLELKEFQLGFGDEIVFQNSSDEIKGVLIDFSSDKSGCWYNLCLLNEGKLFGRHI